MKCIKNWRLYLFMVVLCLWLWMQHFWMFQNDSLKTKGKECTCLAHSALKSDFWKLLMAFSNTIKFMFAWWGKPPVTSVNHLVISYSRKEKITNCIHMCFPLQNFVLPWYKIIVNFEKPIHPENYYFIYLLDKWLLKIVFVTEE